MNESVNAYQGRIKIPRRAHKSNLKPLVRSLKLNNNSVYTKTGTAQWIGPNDSIVVGEAQLKKWGKIIKLPFCYSQDP